MLYKHLISKHNPDEEEIKACEQNLRIKFQKKQTNQLAYLIGIKNNTTFCNTCNTTFLSNKALTEHVDKYHNLTEYFCTYRKNNKQCDRKFHLIKDLIKHQDTSNHNKTIKQLLQNNNQLSEPHLFSETHLINHPKLKSPKKNDPYYKPHAMLNSAVPPVDIVDQRNTYRDFILKNLLDKNGPPNAFDLATILEDEIFTKFQAINAKYKQKVRTIIFNTKKITTNSPTMPHNPIIRENLLTGKLSPFELVNASIEDLATKKLNNLRLKLNHQNIREKSIASNLPTQKTGIKCINCLNYTCSSTNLQIRSADEAMTTFIHCQTCDKRWRI